MCAGMDSVLLIIGDVTYTYCLDGESVLKDLRASIRDDAQDEKLDVGFQQDGHTSISTRKFDGTKATTLRSAAVRGQQAEELFRS